ncbi:hypothetical protein, partial [Mucilaginibacter sp.]|uniref:hypothetical protein n=1 Tax=Mucilaginibacter sp. TaxID=1882438 RepID=UPI00326565C5
VTVPMAKVKMVAMVKNVVFMIPNILIVSAICVFRFIKYTHMTHPFRKRYSEIRPIRRTAGLHR